ncbi:MAG: VWA domain-containing protein [Planctomycetes bacterium]|nr:VWA domain-containing protein [Planctomycetota bacterium]
MLAAIEFLAPLFLLATLAAVIPLVIHMLQRQRAQEMPFSTLRFLKLSVEKTARKRRLRDLWLLLLRMAVVVILALGLAKPFLRGSTKLFSNRAAAIVIILDNSPSMSLSDGGEVRFERARTLALKVLDQVREEDEVALLLTGGPSLQQELLYRRVENVQRLIEQARVCLSGADIPAALQRARRLLQQSESPNKEIYLITDLQRSGWQPGSAADDAAKPPGQTVEDEAEAADEQSDGPIPTVVIDVHRERPTNLSLETVEQQVAVPAVGLPVRIIATVRNGALSEQDAQVELTIDGQLIEQSETIRLAPGEKRAFEFLYTPQKAGIQEGRVALVGQDAGPIDNQRFFVLDTQSPVQVALVDQRSGEEVLYRSASYYLERALRPIREGQYAMEVTVLKPELLKDEPLANYSTVLCVDLTPPERRHPRGARTIRLQRRHAVLGLRAE